MPRTFAPIAGRIKWCRALECHLNELVSSVTSHPVLKTLPTTKDLENKYSSVRNILTEYEQEMINIWLDQDVAVADCALLQPVLAVQHDRLYVNLHPTIPLLIREATCLAKMNIELPIVAATLFTKQNHFYAIQDSLNVRLHSSFYFFSFIYFKLVSFFSIDLDKYVPENGKTSQVGSTAIVFTTASSVDIAVETWITSHKSTACI